MAGINGGIIGPVSTVGPAPAKVTSFTSSGTYTPSFNRGSVTVLVVAGGGAGGGPDRGGGGGAGGFRTATCHPVPTNGTGITVTIGAGANQPGTSSGATTNQSGNNTVFASPSNPITSAKGGYGAWACGADASCSPQGVPAVAGAGGSGGGGVSSAPGSGFTHPSKAAGNTPPTSPSQGNAGGEGCNLPCSAGGGGGGAGAVGVNAGSNVGGAGGAGVSNSITGSAVVYAGGGGGHGMNGNAAGAGGNGGGGAGSAGPSSARGTAGSANTGGGGGGASLCNSGGGAGGSGIVVVKEPAKDNAVAPGVWSLNEVYDKVSAGTWTN